jgi:thiol-disulfide isomerase/thioredoxin
MTRTLHPLTALATFFALASAAWAEQDSRFPPTPDFPTGLQWLNIAHPLSLEDLRGKVVILDFWTYGCINCIHVMDELARLRARYGNKLAVVGVHSPKFENERNIETLKRILVRYQHSEPVVNVPDYRMMRAYGVRAWPTLVVLDPLGGYVGGVAGEGNEKRLGRAIDKLLAMYPDAIDETPIVLTLVGSAKGEGRFAAPDKIAVAENRIAISDSLFNRVLVATRECKILCAIGGKDAGSKDGTLADARFHAPRGLALDGDALYIAMAGEHPVGRRHAGAGKNGSIQRLNEPGGLAVVGDRVLIADTNNGRILSYDPHSKASKLWAPIK